jgi:hypothetical protein
MQLILSLSVFFGCLQLSIAAKMPKPEEFASALYRTGSKRVTAFFKNAGSLVDNNLHPSLRTESDPVLHERATAHFTIFKDNGCTIIDHILDVKINRCADYLGNIKATITGEELDQYSVSIQQFDESCESSLGPPKVQVFQKNVCAVSDVGLGYMTFNLIGNPKKSIPGGGGAFVFYDNKFDC